MVTVAVAGGGSTLGSNIIAAILATHHHLVVLSRSPRPDLEAEGATVRTVDYSSISELEKALYGVQTVISCIFSYTADFSTSEIALLEASKAANVRRFVPSDWAVDRYEDIGMYTPKIPVWEAVQKSGLEYTRFIPGFWMNLWGVGAAHNEIEARSGYKGPAFLIDVQNHTATIPGDGSQKVVFTEMRDVGKAVAGSLSLPNWDPDSRIVGDNPTFNELVILAEKITGQTFTKKYVSEVEIERVLAESSDPGERFQYQFMKVIASGGFDFKDTLKAKLSGFEPVGAEEFLTKHWSTGV